ncbi:S1 RNA-binding domain-containing protein [Desulfofalx alkaliphila]|uniref:S1 RNA-binding domain-containing protein n=1 Tax=Desulfofalx alkaliphila TaxID=105483 RepID=UPI0004E1E767|nr:S1 RNA-binding domain-containing protein [Desulfofalx alkaliphila]
MTIALGKVVEGVVTGITSFGAFVQLPGNKTGLVHISEIADEYVRDVNDFLKVNDRVSVKVLSVDDKGKIGLSIKRTKPKPTSAGGYGRSKKQEMSFEDKMTKFLKESEERQQQLRRSTENKRGFRGSR